MAQLNTEARKTQKNSDNHHVLGIVTEVAAGLSYNKEQQ
jgi:hypothetical protein